MNAFHQKLAAILEVESLQPADTLRSFDSWDSLAILSTIAMVDSDYHIVLNGAKLAAAETVADVWSLVDDNRDVGSAGPL